MVVIVIVVGIVADSVHDVEGGVGRDEEEGGKVESLGDSGTSSLFSRQGGTSWQKTGIASPLLRSIGFVNLVLEA